MNNKNPHILLLDDDPNLLMTLSDILKLKGFEPVVAQTGRAAIETISQYPIDVVLIDLRLTDMSGLDVLRLIKSQSPNIECIMLTGHASQASAIEAVNLGAYSYFQKPFDMESLLLFIRRAIERKEAKLALAESEARYHTFINATTDMAFLKNDQLEYLIVNQACADFFKNPIEKIIGRNNFDFLDHQIAERSHQAEMLILETNKPITSIQRTASRIYEINKFPVPLQNGKIGIGGFVRDITERQLAEEKLAASEAELRALFSSMKDVVLVIDKNGVYQKIAPTNPDALIKTPDQLLGKSLHEIFPGEQSELFMLTIQQVLDTDQPGKIDYQIPIKGQTVYFRATISPMNSTDTLWVIRDISENRQAEEKLRESEMRFRSTFEQAAVGVAHLTPQGQWLLVNQKLCDIVGYSQAELRQKTFQDITYVDDLETDLEYSRQILAGEIKTFAMEKRYIHKNGSLVWTNLTVSLVRTAAGEPDYFISVIEDIRERKQTEEKMQQQKVAIQQHAHRQEQLAALGRALSATLDLEIIYSTAYQFLNTLIDCSVFRITLFDSEKKLLKAVYFNVDGLSADPNLLAQLKYNPTQPAKGRSKAINTKAPQIVRVLESGKTWNKDFSELSEKETKSAIYVPMIVEDKVIGLLDFQSYNENIYKMEDGEWLSVVANQIGMSIQNANLYAGTQQRIAELLAMQAIVSAVLAHLEPKETFDVLLDQIISRLRVDAVDILLFNPQSQKLEYAAGRGFRTVAIEKTRLNLGDGLAGQAALEQKIVKISYPSDENNYFLNIKNWSGEDFKEYFGVPLLADKNLIGVLEVFRHETMPSDQDWLRFLEMLATQAAVVIETIQLYEDIHNANEDLFKAYNATIEGWSQAMDLRDRETEGHTKRVTELMLSLAKEAGVPEDMLIHIRRGALLHDIGKLGVPDSILFKPGKLTADEWAEMKKHPAHAYRMLSKVEYLRPALDIPYCHHEKWDGTGYPRGLKGEEIPLSARLFAIVDVWDALTSDRPYRPAWTKEEAFKYIKDQAGLHFDPNLVEAFLAMIKKNGLI